MSILKTLINDALITRKKKNPLYSLRALARTLEVSPSHLSNFMTGRKAVSKELALQILEKLNADLKAIQDVISEINEIEKNSFDPTFKTLQDEEFKIICDWEHFAILSLAHIRNNSVQPKWIAERLGIPIDRASECFQRLVKMKIVEISGEKFKQVSPPLQSTIDIPSDAVRESHRQNLQLATRKLDDVSVENREYNSITFEFDPKRMPTLKKMIRKFRSEVSQYGSQGQPSEVYTFSMQLFPLTNPDKNEGT